MGNCWGSEDGFKLQDKYSRNSNGHSSSSTGLSSKGLSSSLVSVSTTESFATPSHNEAVIFGQPSASSHLRCFAFSDLKAATHNFRQDNVLGEGGFGSVFKGWLDEQTYAASRPGTGIVVAVKKLNPESAQGHKEWLTEVHVLGQLLHPNLVRLIGYCGEDDQRLLVYEFMPRGSLENHLFRRGAPIPWAVRMKVAVGAAKGLAFLHNAGVIYRDLKTSNILLDPEYTAKLSDFGLAKEGPTGDNTHVSTNVIGTFGYAAPEYVATGHLTLQSDVYSFGVVLLEILTGRHAFEKSRPFEEQDLVDWARPYLSERRKVYRLMDPRLEGQCSRRGFEIAADLAYKCLHTDAKARPPMKEVVETLEPLISSRESKSSVDLLQRHGHVTTSTTTRNGQSPLPSFRQNASPMRR